MLNTSVPCFLASICFYKSGSPYAEFKTKQSEEKVEAEEIASEIQLNTRKESISVMMKARISGVPVFYQGPLDGSRPAAYSSNIRPCDLEKSVQPLNEINSS